MYCIIAVFGKFSVYGLFDIKSSTTSFSKINRYCMQGVGWLNKYEIFNLVSIFNASTGKFDIYFHFYCCFNFFFKNKGISKYSRPSLIQIPLTICNHPLIRPLANPNKIPPPDFLFTIHSAGVPTS